MTDKPLEEVASDPSTLLSAPTQGLSWYQIWINAISQPSEETYERLLEDPHFSLRRVIFWVSIIALAGGISPSPVLPLLPLSLFGILINLAVFLFAVGVAQFFADILGGKGTYLQLVYILAAIHAPFALISIPITFLPNGAGINLVISLYPMFLSAIALKTVNGFGYKQVVIVGWLMSTNSADEINYEAWTFQS